MDLPLLWDVCAYSAAGFLFQLSVAFLGTGNDSQMIFNLSLGCEAKQGRSILLR